MDLSSSTGRAVSLSMRMRSEASLSPQSKLPTIQGSSSTDMLSSSKRMGSSLRLKPNAALSMSKEDLLRESARQELVMESAAMNIDAVASGGVFADRTIMTQPSASCVRCGNHASVCMSCTEFLAEEALNFYRKTRARGAASLFANAITQTGVTKVVKYIMFVTWRNGFRERKWRGRKLAFKADIMYRNHFLKATFFGWVKFNTGTVKENRDKKIEELEKRITTLESVTQQATNLKDSAERQAKQLQSQFDKLSKKIEEQEEHIARLEASKVADRGRVVGLSALVGPMLKYERLQSSGTEATLADLQAALNRLSMQQQAHYNYGKTYNREDVEGLFFAEKKRREKGKQIDLEELDPSNYEMVEMLLQWASAKSREANNILEPGTGKALKFLPKYRACDTFDDLKNGGALLRIVLALVWDLPRKVEQPGTDHKIDGGTGTGTGTGADTDTDMRSIPYDVILSRIEESTKSKVALSMVECALSLGRTHLSLPNYHAADIVSARPEVCATLLAHLMLASAVPTQPQVHLQKTAKLIGSFEECRRDLTSARLGVSGVAKVRKIDHSLGILLGTVKAEVQARGGNDPQKEKKEVGSNAPPQMGDDADSGAGSADADAGGQETKSGDSDAAASGDGDGDGDGEGKKEQTRKGVADSEPAKPPHEQHYARLTGSVDSYLASLGEWDDSSYTWTALRPGSNDTPGDTPGEAGPGGSNNPFIAELEAYEAKLADLAALKEACAEHRGSSESAGRLASDVRRHIAAFTNDIYLQELKWLE